MKANTLSTISFIIKKGGNFILEEVIDFLNWLTTLPKEEVNSFFLGKGSTREAYSFKDEYIIKIPRFVVQFDSQELNSEQVLNIIKKGVKQTYTEIAVFESCKEEYKYLLNPIVTKGLFLNMPFVVMPKIKIASKIVPFDIYNLNSFIEFMGLCVPNNFYKNIEELSASHNLYYGDLVDNMDNFGIDKCNRVIIADYGTRSDV